MHDQRGSARFLVAGGVWRQRTRTKHERCAEREERYDP
jgi:hypothetical protein